MVAELKEVISKVEKLQDDEQKQLAKLLEEEIEWNTTFEKTQNQLSNLAQEAIAEYKAGETRKEDW